MKTVFKVFFVLFLALISVNSFAQKKGKKTDFDPIVKELLDKKEYKLRALTAFPRGWRSVSLDYRYSLKIKGDSVYCHLPYFGRAYTLPYGGGEGLVFDGVSTDYKVKDGKKGSWIIEFSVRTREDNYKFMINLYPNGSASINVGSNNKQSIDFHSEMIKDEDIEIVKKRDKEKKSGDVKK